MGPEVTGTAVGRRKVLVLRLSSSLSSTRSPATLGLTATSHVCRTPSRSILVIEITARRSRRPIALA